MGKLLIWVKNKYHKFLNHILSIIFSIKMKEEFDKINSEMKGRNEFALTTTENPVVWLGMFKKIILNNLNFNRKVEKFFTDNKEFEYDPKELEDASNFVVYHRAWFYISKMKLDNRVDKGAIIISSDEDLVLSLRMALKFFEYIEDYEKCAFIKEVLDEVLLSLKENVPS